MDVYTEKVKFDFICRIKLLTVIINCHSKFVFLFVI